MISRIIFILFSIIIFSCTSNNNKQSIDLYGVDFSYDSIESISNIIENSDQFLTQEIIVEGEIIDVCPMKGCWIEIKD